MSERSFHRWGVGWRTTPVLALLLAALALAEPAPRVAHAAPTVLGEWKFDEGSGNVALDTSGGGHDGEIRSGSHAPGHLGGHSLQLDGPNFWGGVWMTPVDIGTDSFALGAWIKTEAASGAVVGHQYDLTLAGYQLGVDGGVVRFTMFSSTLLGGTAVDDGEWHFVAAARTTAEAYVCVDGILDGTGIGSNASMANGGPLTVGTAGGFQLPGFSGLVDEVKIAKGVDGCLTPFAGLVVPPVTTSTFVDVAVLPPADATHMQLSLSPDFVGATWQPWRLEMGLVLPDVDGPHTAYARFRDAALNVSEAYADTTILDRGPPDSTLASLAPTQAIATFLLSWSGSDATTDVASYELEYRDHGAVDSGEPGTPGAWTSIPPTGIATTASFEGVQRHRYCFRLRATDLLGNTEDWSDGDGTCTRVADITQPSGGIVINSGLPFTNQTPVEVSLPATDNGVPAEMQLSEDAGFVGAVWQAHATSVQWALDDGDGEYTVYVRYRDGEGNESGAYSDSVALDTVAPPSGAVLVNGGAFSTTDPAVRVAVTAEADKASGLASLRLSSDGVSWGDWQDTSDRFRYSFGQGDGTKIVYLQFRDGAGNLSLPATDAIDLDMSAGIDFSGVSINNTATFTNSPSVVLSLVAPRFAHHEPGEGRLAAAMRISNDGSFSGSTWEPFSSHKVWTIRTYSDQVITDVVYVQFRSVDGDPPLVSEIYSDDIVYDPNAPEYTPPPPVAHAPAAIGGTKTVRLNTKAEDDRSGVAQMKLSNDAGFTDAQWEPYSASRAWPVNSDAATTVYMRFRDTAGNESKTYSTALAAPAAATVPTQVAPVHGLFASLRPTFRWLAVAGARKYEVQVAANDRFAPLLESGSTAGTAWRPGKALPAEKKLFWRVRVAVGAWSPAWQFRTPLLDGPAPASPNEGVLVTTLSPVLKWKKVPGATSYQVQLSTSPLFIEGYSSFTSAKPSLVLPPLARKATYYWQVRGKKGKAWGAWSGVRSFETPAIAVPQPLRPRPGALVKGLPLVIDWLDVPGAEKYRLQVCKDVECTKTYKRVDVGESLRVFEKLPRGAYWWRVAALGRRGVVGEWSAVRGFRR